MHNDRSHKNYLLMLIATIAVPTSLLIAGSFVLDPFAIYPSVIETSQQRSVDLFWNLRLHKPHRVRQEAAEHLIMGSSRSGRLTPRYLASDNEPSYNASVPGATLHEMLRHIEHAQATQPLKTLFIGLDYYMFRDDKPLFMPGFEESRLLKLDPSWLDQARYRWRRLLDAWTTLYSRSALTADLRSVFGEQPSQRTFYQDGTWRVQVGDLGGHWVYAILAKQKIEEFSELSRHLDYRVLERILDFCAAHDIELSILISPLHAHQMKLIDMLDAWPDYLQYQRDIVELVEQYKSLTEKPLRVLALEHSEPLVYEPISNDARWFLDGIHYTKETGGELLACFREHFLERASARRCDDDFLPQQLESQTVDDYLRGVSDKMQAYPQRRPDDYARLQKQLLKVRSQSPAPVQ